MHLELLPRSGRLVLVTVGVLAFAWGWVVSEPAPPASKPTPAPQAPTGDRVRLVVKPGLGGASAVEVRFVGPSSSQDIYSAAFDLILSEPALVELAGSKPGDLFPGQPLVQAVLANDRLVVGVTLLGEPRGVGVPAKEATLLTILLKPKASGKLQLAFAPASPGKPGPQFLDSKGKAITGITFSVEPVVLVLK